MIKSIPDTPNNDDLLKKEASRYSKYVLAWLLYGFVTRAGAVPFMFAWASVLFSETEEVYTKSEQLGRIARGFWGNKRYDRRCRSNPPLWVEEESLRLLHYVFSCHFSIRFPLKVLIAPFTNTCMGLTKHQSPNIFPTSTILIPKVTLLPMDS